MPDSPTSLQSEYWRSAQKWVDCQVQLDAVMQPALDRLLSEAALQPGERVLDIGCGTGASTMAAARAVGPSGHVAGADISEIMLDLAHERTSQAGLQNVSYAAGDAQTHAFPEAGYDKIISRFGVMFFADAVAAFRNIAGALKPGGRMIFLAWAGPDGNPWFSVPSKAAIEVLGKPAPTDPRAPGPMAFQERDYVTTILENAGWREIAIREVAVDLTPQGTVAEIAEFATRLGPATRIIEEFDGGEADIQEIAANVAQALARYENGDAVRVPAALNLVQATI